MRDRQSGTNIPNNKNKQQTKNLDYTTQKKTNQSKQLTVQASRTSQLTIQKKTSGSSLIVYGR